MNAFIYKGQLNIEIVLLDLMQAWHTKKDNFIFKVSTTLLPVINAQLMCLILTNDMATDILGVGEILQ